LDQFPGKYSPTIRTGRWGYQQEHLFDRIEGLDLDWLDLHSMEKNQKQKLIQAYFLMDSFVLLKFSFRISVPLLKQFNL